MGNESGGKWTDRFMSTAPRRVASLALVGYAGVDIGDKILNAITLNVVHRNPYLAPDKIGLAGAIGLSGASVIVDYRKYRANTRIEREQEEQSQSA